MSTGLPAPSSATTAPDVSRKWWASAPASFADTSRRLPAQQAILTHVECIARLGSWEADPITGASHRSAELSTGCSASLPSATASFGAPRRRAPVRPAPPFCDDAPTGNNGQPTLMPASTCAAPENGGESRTRVHFHHRGHPNRCRRHPAAGHRAGRILPVAPPKPAIHYFRSTTIPHRLAPTTAPLWSTAPNRFSPSPAATSCAWRTVPSISINPQDHQRHPSATRWATARSAVQLSGSPAACATEEYPARHRWRRMVVLLPAPARLRPDDAATARKLISQPHRPSTWAQPGSVTSASVGVALYPGNGADINTPAQARRHRHTTPGEGRTTSRLHVFDMNSRAYARLAQNAPAPRPLDLNELSSNTSPGGRCPGCDRRRREALVLEPPRARRVSPHEFIPIAEETRPHPAPGRLELLREATAVSRPEWQTWSAPATPARWLPSTSLGPAVPQTGFPAPVRQIIAETAPPDRLEFELHRGVLDAAHPSKSKARSPPCARHGHVASRSTTSAPAAQPALPSVRPSPTSRSTDRSFVARPARRRRRRRHRRCHPLHRPRPGLRSSPRRRKPKPSAISSSSASAACDGFCSPGCCLPKSAPRSYLPAAPTAQQTAGQ